MDNRQRAILLAGYNAAIAQAEQIFAPPQRTHNRTPNLSGEELAKAKGLHKWAIGGFYIYAKTIRDAIKRAKKRGLWKEDSSVKLIEL